MRSAREDYLRQEEEEAKVDRAIKDHTPFIIDLNPLFS